ncbi:glycosyltransferase family 1 protein [Halobacteriales archaeon SW_5_70_135]|nr:MAG: glycosyltransferase family 1 protein [Halobacteriales archaeon SW_5_70_135]
MHVGLVVYGDLTPTSGGYLYDRRLVRHLRERGDRVDLVSLPRRGYASALTDNLTPGLYRALARDYDVLLQDELCHPSLVAANRLPGVSAPVVAVVHHLRASEPRRLRPLYRAVERRYLEAVDATVCNGETTRAAVADLLGREPPGVVAPPAGDRFDPEIADREIRERAHQGPLRLLFVGNVTRRKGLDALVGGLATVDGDWRLTVVGDTTVDPEYVDRVRRQVRAEGVEDRVTVAGRLPDDELAAALREHHLLAVPSRYEGYGIVYLEGMSFGLPALASRAGGAAEFVDDDCGFLVDPGDRAAVAGHVTALLADRDRLAEMGIAARRRYEAHPSWEASAARARELLLSVAGDAER